MKHNINHEIELYLHETFKALLEHEVRKSRRYKHPVSLLHIALDVEPNTPEAQRAAEMIAINALDAELRESDIPSLDENEFLVLLPFTDEHGARKACERLEKALNVKDETYDDGTFQMSAYIGFTSASADAGVSPSKLKEQALKAMECARSDRSQKAVSFSELK
jgi:GGDEF domain-containing protein